MDGISHSPRFSLIIEHGYKALAQASPDCKETPLRTLHKIYSRDSS